MNKKRVVSVFLGLILLISAPLNSIASGKMEFNDMPNNWAREGLLHAVENNILRGDNKGNINPNNKLTRAEFAVMVSRLLKLEENANLESIKDVPKDAWYYNGLARAVKAGIMKGSNNRIRPNEPITREEAFVVLARVYHIAEQSDSIRNFKDWKQISDWALKPTSGLVERGYISGDQNRMINPKKHITRAEMATLLYNTAPRISIEERTYENKVVKGNFILNNGKASLRDIVIAEDLILTEGVGCSKLRLEDIVVDGKIVVRYCNDLELRGKSDIKEILVLGGIEGTKIYVDEDVNIGKISTSSKIVVEGKGKVEEIEFKEGSNGSHVRVKEVFVNKDGAEDIKDAQGKLVKQNKIIINKEIPLPNFDFGGNLSQNTHEDGKKQDLLKEEILDKLEAFQNKDLKEKENILNEIKDLEKQLDGELSQLVKDKIDRAREDYEYNKILDEINNNQNLKENLQTVIDRIQKGKEDQYEITDQVVDLFEKKKGEEDLDFKDLENIIKDSVKDANLLDDLDTILDREQINKDEVDSIEDKLDNLEDEIKDYIKDKLDQLNKLKEKIKAKNINRQLGKLKVEELGLKDKQDIEKLRKEVNSIRDEFKKLLTNLKKLEAAEEKIQNLEKDQDLELQAKDIDKRIDSFLETQEPLNKLDDMKKLQDEIKALEKDLRDKLNQEKLKKLDQLIENTERQLAEKEDDEKLNLKVKQIQAKIDGFMSTEDPFNQVEAMKELQKEIKELDTNIKTKLNKEKLDKFNEFVSKVEKEVKLLKDIRELNDELAKLDVENISLKDTKKVEELRQRVGKVAKRHEHLLEGLANLEKAEEIIKELQYQEQLELVDKIKIEEIEKRLEQVEGKTLKEKQAILKDIDKIVEGMDRKPNKDLVREIDKLREEVQLEIIDSTKERMILKRLKEAEGKSIEEKEVILKDIDEIVEGMDRKPNKDLVREIDKLREEVQLEIIDSTKERMISKRLKEAEGKSIEEKEVILKYIDEIVEGMDRKPNKDLVREIDKLREEVQLEIIDSTKERMISKRLKEAEGKSIEEKEVILKDIDEIVEGMDRKPNKDLVREIDKLREEVQLEIIDSTKERMISKRLKEAEGKIIEEKEVILKDIDEIVEGMDRKPNKDLVREIDKLREEVQLEIIDSTKERMISKRLKEAEGKSIEEKEVILKYIDEIVEGMDRKPNKDLVREIDKLREEVQLEIIDSTKERMISKRLKEAEGKSIEEKEVILKDIDEIVEGMDRKPNKDLVREIDKLREEVQLEIIEKTILKELEKFEDKSLEEKGKSLDNISSFLKDKGKTEKDLSQDLQDKIKKVKDDYSYWKILDQINKGENLKENLQIIADKIQSGKVDKYEITDEVVEIFKDKKEGKELDFKELDTLIKESVKDAELISDLDDIIDGEDIDQDQATSLKDKLEQLGNNIKDFIQDKLDKLDDKLNKVKEEKEVRSLNKELGKLNLGAIDLGDREQVEDLRNRVEKVKNEYMELLTNLDNLEKAEKIIEELKEQELIEKKLKEVEGKTLEEKEAILKEIDKIVETMAAEPKEELIKEIDKLREEVKELNIEKDLKAIEEQIDYFLSSKNILNEMKDMKKLQKEIENLDESVKSKLDQAKLNKLSNKITWVEKEKQAIKIAAALNQEIGQLELDKLSLDDAKNIENLRSRVEKLEQRHKHMITNLTKLKKAEEKIEGLEVEAKVKEVEKKILELVSNFQNKNLKEKKDSLVQVENLLKEGQVSKEDLREEVQLAIDRVKDDYKYWEILDQINKGENLKENLQSLVDKIQSGKEEKYTITDEIVEIFKKNKKEKIVSFAELKEQIKDAIEEAQKVNEEKINKLLDDYRNVNITEERESILKEIDSLILNKNVPEDLQEKIEAARIDNKSQINIEKLNSHSHTKTKEGLEWFLEYLYEDKDIVVDLPFVKDFLDLKGDKYIGFIQIQEILEEILAS